MVHKQSTNQQKYITAMFCVHLPRSSSADFAAARDEVLDIHGTLDTEDVVNAAAEPIMVAIIASLYCVI